MQINSIDAVSLKNCLDDVKALLIDGREVNKYASGEGGRKRFGWLF